MKTNLPCMQRYLVPIYLNPQRHLAQWSKLTDKIIKKRSERPISKICSKYGWRQGRDYLHFINRINIQIFKLYPIRTSTKNLYLSGFVAVYDHRQCSLKRSDWSHFNFMTQRKIYSLNSLLSAAYQMKCQLLFLKASLTFNVVISPVQVLFTYIFLSEEVGISWMTVWE